MSGGRFRRGWQRVNDTRAGMVVGALMLGCAAAIVVLGFDIRARVDGSMTYCGNGVSGVVVPYLEDPPAVFFAECEAAVARWRRGAVVAGAAVAAVGYGGGERRRRRRAST